jgi:hypothetical protein
MSKENDDDFFTKKHARLANFALAANIFAWIVLIVHLFLVLGKYIEVQNTYSVRLLTSGQVSDFAGMLKENPSYAASLYIGMLGIFLRGVVYALVLKGISLGLYTILETDLNKKGADDDGSVPVFYKPQVVFWLEKWMSRASIAMIIFNAFESILSFSWIKEVALSFFINQIGADTSATIAAGVMIALGFVFMSALYFFLLKSLSYALKILMEVEFNSRRPQP